MSETTTIAAAGTTTQPRFAAFNADGSMTLEDARGRRRDFLAGEATLLPS